MILKHVRDEVERLLDEAAEGHLGDGVKAVVQRAEVLEAVIELLGSVERDLTSEAEALVLTIGRASRDGRRKKMGADVLHIVDGFTEDGGYIDPLLSLAFPVGTDDGLVKTLRYWTVEDFEISVRMAYRKAAEVTVAARAHDEAMTAAVRSMRLRGVFTFGDSTGRTT